MPMLDVMVKAEAAELLRKEAAKTGRTEDEILHEIVMRELSRPEPGEYVPDESDDPMLNDKMGRVVSDLIIRVLRKQ